MTESQLMDSAFSNSILAASTWNRKKSDQPIRGRPLFAGTSGVDNDNENTDNNYSPQPPREGHHLLEKRHYSNPIHDDDVAAETDGNIDAIAATEKSVLENSVLHDCLSTHFLFSHLPESDLRRLCDTFEKIRFRNHEVIYSKGDESQFFYILFSGEVAQRDGQKSTIDSDDTKDDAKYTVLGELSVLIGAPHQETVVAACNCVLFRIDRVAFHRALQPCVEFNSDERVRLLKEAIPDEMVDHFIESELLQLASAMSTHTFQAGDVLVDKETRLDSLIIIAKGLVIAKDISLGGRIYDDASFGPDSSSISFGWQAILTGDHDTIFRGNMVAHTNGSALILPRASFCNTMGGGESVTLHRLAERRLARIQLQNIPVFQDSFLTETQINGLLDLMHRCEYSSESGKEQMTICKAGDKIDARMYFVREGAVTLLRNKGEDKTVIEAGDYFGEQNMLRDQHKDGKKHFVIRSPMTAIAHAPRTIVDVLYLEECRGLINTSLLGLGESEHGSEVGTVIQWEDIHRHSLLGAGTFGQVWLASISSAIQSEDLPVDSDEDELSTTKTSRRIVALKIQSKYEVVEAGKAERVVAERNILASMHSPFLLQHICSFQDESRLYMLTSLLQGGELESLIPDDGLSEHAAKFYAAGILEGLAYMHRHHIVHRDIKPQNVLLNEKGYPVLIDFGFAKYVPDKTYTFCGSPIFTAPEIIRFQGHGRASDNWAWAVLVYRLVTGKYPFYKDGIDELQLYKRICKGSLELDGLMSMEFRMLMVAVLYPDPRQRLGSARSGWRDLFASSWLSNDGTIDLGRLRKQGIPAPWTPDIQGDLDASSFHPDSSDLEDLMDRLFPEIADKQQQIFNNFGPQIFTF